MKNIKVLGPGCRNCETMANVIAQAAKEAGIEIDGRVVHSGGVPGADLVRKWISDPG